MPAFGATSSLSAVFRASSKLSVPFRQTPLLQTAKSKSSKQWLARQSNDPYVRARVGAGPRQLLPKHSNLANRPATDNPHARPSPLRFRSRSAFKLVEIDEQYNLLSHDDVRVVVDLGAAPGGWSQVASARMGWSSEVAIPPPTSLGLKEQMGRETLLLGGEHDQGVVWNDENDPDNILRKKKKVAKVKQQEQALEVYDPLNIDDLDRPGGEEAMTKGRGTIIALDLLNIQAILGVKTVTRDFLAPETDKYLESLLIETDGYHPTGDGRGKVDVILSDMAANATGNDTSDIEASLRICEAVLEFAKRHLKTADSIGRRNGGVML